MGKHDAWSHLLHISKSIKFKQPRPNTAPRQVTLKAPQQPRPGTNAFNHFR